MKAGAERPYTDDVRGWLYACVLSLVVATAASAATYRVHVPGARGVEAPAVTRAGNWDVSVTFDPDGSPRFYAIAAAPAPLPDPR